MTSFIKNNLNKKFSIYAIVWILFYQTLHITKVKNKEIIYDYAQKTFKHKVKFLLKLKTISFGNIIVWKVIYGEVIHLFEKYYVNAIRLSLDHKIYPGESIEKLDGK